MAEGKRLGRYGVGSVCHVLLLEAGVPETYKLFYSHLSAILLVLRTCIDIVNVGGGKNGYSFQIFIATVKDTGGWLIWLPCGEQLDEAHRGLIQKGTRSKCDPNYPQS